jgi:hypothetical protein
VLEKLNIALYQDPNAKAKPVEIRPRILRTVVAKPAAKAQEEPSLIRDDVLTLVDFIDQYARQFEVAPKTYARLDEEELRDLIVSMMNANYPGSTTAETFSKFGKTDIRLQVNKGNVLICECKIWEGPKAYGDAIDQLFGYLTWRQNYGVLLTFCKRKDMTGALTQAKAVSQRHGSFADGSLSEQSTSRFLTRHRHPQDAKKSVEVFHIFIDLSV